MNLTEKPADRGIINHGVKSGISAKKDSSFNVKYSCEIGRRIEDVILKDPKSYLKNDLFPPCL